MHYPTQPPRDNESLQTELVYDYSKEYLQSKRKILDSINGRLTTLLGFSGLLLRFCLDLPSGCPSVKLFKLGALSLSSCAVLVCCLGLTTETTGRMINPQDIVEFFLDEKEIEIKERITRTIYETAEDIVASYRRKSRFLNWSIGLATASAIAFGVNGILATFFEICSKQSN